MEEAARAAVLRLSALARLARADVLGDVDVLAHPEGEALRQRPRLGSPEIFLQRAIVAVAKYLCAQPAAGGGRRGGPPRPARAGTGGHSAPGTSHLWAGPAMGMPSLFTSLPNAAAAPRTMGTKIASTASSSAQVWTSTGERNRSSEGTRGAGAVVVPVSGNSSEPASATNILVHRARRGQRRPPRLGRVRGSLSPYGRRRTSPLPISV